ncbi:hypothetical protein Aph02nite_26650 [Actinoplanes philippinensis]|uniref:Uncharacterized protein n=1 Tax=Actinoplanes philippinensis TaxID=35752 RepID=A0A1I2GAV9_9ACTN|nr:hypothetical protein [Actinoplanes philippinensis]GIE76715.1 hypothetical protein Aph02nite_26650 [Actinoplanes philippinensis]SFF13801.1 hypothetical protein SAMN05421541_106321 [Actinoplanes philippinensis]
MTAVDVILDLRQWPDRVRDPAGLTALWDQVERALDGTDLRRRPENRVTLARGVVAVRLARAEAAAVIRRDTAVRVVNVLEKPRLRHPCRACVTPGRESEGVFRCPGCDDGGRLCAGHAQVLDGALIGTCRRHRPACAECGATATYRCTGPGCRGRSAHCDRHRRSRAGATGWAYCPGCHGTLFPDCAIAKCGNVGSAGCEFTDDRLRGCGQRLCPEHLRRWQVYGPERLGLALCARHETALGTVPAAELIRRIVGGTWARHQSDRRADPLPSLRAFGYTLRNFKHFTQANDPHWIRKTLTASGDAFGPAAAKVRDFVRLRDTGTARPWQREIEELDGDRGSGEKLLDQARAVLRAQGGRDGARMAGELSLGGYIAPRRIGGEDRPGQLYVLVPRARRDLFRTWQAAMSRDLTRRNGSEIVVLPDRGSGGTR